MPQSIAGPDVFICDECVLICFDIITPTELEDVLPIESRHRRENLLKRMVKDLTFELETILSVERKRHSPYERLETVLHNVRTHDLMFNRPPEETAPGTAAETVSFPSPPPQTS